MVLGRKKFIYGAIPAKTKRLLDVGCASGYHTTYYARKAKKCYGVDPEKKYLLKAKKRYPGIDFRISTAEKTGFKDNFFDCIVMSEIVEHLKDEGKAFKEANRILKKDGSLIITTMHKNILGFLDPDNYIWFIRKYFYPLYKLIFKIKGVSYDRPGYTTRHKHYSKKEMRKMLGPGFKVTKIRRSGFLLYALAINTLFVLNILFKGSKTPIHKILTRLKGIDYSMGYGPLSWNIGIVAKKR